MRTKIIVGTRGSQLAMTQTEQFVNEVRKANPGLEITIVRIVTAGDREQHKQWDSVEGTGVFVKELENALLEGKIDFAVHSLKDMPVDVPEGLCLPAITRRVDPRDVLITKDGKNLEDLPAGSKIGTGSPRRTIQLKAFRSDLVPVPIRGNVDTRLRKATSGELDGVIIAAAGISRLGWAERISQFLPVEKFLPAVGQGALAIESRCDDEEVITLLKPFNDTATERSVTAERSLLRALGGGCRAPIAALGTVEGDKLNLRAMYAEEDGSKLVSAEMEGKPADAEKIGEKLAKKLLQLREAFVNESKKINKSGSDVKINMGKVYLVGAGPGDPGLITVKGLECLKQAEVVVYDRLVDERLTEFFPEKAERIYVGKSREGHTLTQSGINQVLVEKALEGKNVVRLKGGDPYVFGRGGEEVEELVKHGISFEVVPGITTSIAVPSYAGIPVTHRGIATSFAVITGNEDPTKKESGINWQKIAGGADTLVFLMGVENLPKIVEKLLQFGRPPEMPVAIIMNGTRPDQRTITSTLSGIVTLAEKEKVKPPAIILVGEVVKMRPVLSWFDNRPLTGKRVLVTRARQQASNLSRMLADRGAQPVELPAIAVKPIEENKELDNAIKEIGKYQWLVFTSVNGVDAFFERLSRLKLDARALKGVKIAAIGPATGDCLAARGLIADYVPAEFTSRGLLDGLKNKSISGQRFLLPRADIADKELVDGLQAMGAVIEDIPAYQTVPATEAIARAREMLLEHKIDLITFTSSSTVTNLVDAFQGGKVELNGAKVAAIGAKTAETAQKAGLSVDILAKEATIPGLVEAIEEFYAGKANGR